MLDKIKLEEKNRKFFVKLSKRYDDRLFSNLMVKKVEKIIRIAKIKNNSKILEIGCGTGILLNILSNNKSLKLYGIDLTKEMLDEAKIKLKNKASLILCSVRHIKRYFNQNYFDYIMLEDVFHHLPEHKKVIKDISLLLKKGGKLVISDLSFGRFGNKVFHILEPGNSEMYTKKGYYKLLKENKFFDIKQFGVGLFSIYTEGINLKEGKKQ